MDAKTAPAAAAGANAAAASAPATVEQCRVLQQVIKLLEHTEEAKKMLPLANMTPEMLQTTLQVRSCWLHQLLTLLLTAHRNPC